MVREWFSGMVRPWFRSGSGVDEWFGSGSVQSGLGDMSGSGELPGWFGRGSGLIGTLGEVG